MRTHAVTSFCQEDKQCMIQEYERTGSAISEAATSQISNEESRALV